eukprot:14969978-Alexandrium_andersonii.AAC.1
MRVLLCPRALASVACMCRACACANACTRARVRAFVRACLRVTRGWKPLPRISRLANQEVWPCDGSQWGR